MTYSAEQPMEDDTQSFIVRIWRESTDETDHLSTWRGSIERVGTSRKLYFCDLRHVVHFIEEQTNLTCDVGESKWKALLTRARHLLT